MSNKPFAYDYFVDELLSSFACWEAKDLVDYEINDETEEWILRTPHGDIEITKYLDDGETSASWTKQEPRL